MPPRKKNSRGFSLIELVIVVVIIGVISAIAVPRMSAASDTSRLAGVKASLKVLDSAVEMYAAEHGGLLPCHQADGSVDKDAIALAKRLTHKTTADGGLTGTLYGPYLRDLPVNPFNGLKTVRVNGPAAGTSAAGWRFDSTTRRFQADDPIGKAISNDPVVASTGAGDAHGGVSIGDTSLDALDGGATAADGLE